MARPVAGKTALENFINTLFKFMCIFVAIAILGLATVFLIGLPGLEITAPYSIDAQTVGNLFMFVFSSSIAFSGAWIVIDLAVKQEKLAEKQIELESKNTPEYQQAHTRAHSFITGTFKYEVQRSSNQGG